MGVWVKIREESLFFICFCFIGVLECSRSLSAACVCVSVFRTIRRSRTCIICTHTDCRISEVSTIFSVVFERITVPNCSCESPNSVSIHYGLTHQIQVVLIITPLFFLPTSCFGSVAPCLCALFPWSGSFQLPGSLAVAISHHHQQHMHPTSGLQSDWLFWVTFSQNQWEGLSLNTWL